MRRVRRPPAREYHVSVHIATRRRAILPPAVLMLAIAVALLIAIDHLGAVHP